MCILNLIKFPQDYANWLSKNIKYLNEGSLLILKDLKPESFEELRYSTVVELTATDILHFKLSVKGITSGIRQAKRSQLEAAITEANKLDRQITRANFNEVINFVRKTDLNQ